MLYNQLYLANVITSPVFAMFLTATTGQSTLQLGGYDISYLKDPARGLLTIPLSDKTLFWNINIDGFRIGSKSISSALDPNAYYLPGKSTATLDTGTSLMAVPKDIYDTISSKLLKGKNMISYLGYEWTYCSEYT